jgi:hypothetical protein
MVTGYFELLVVKFHLQRSYFQYSTDKWCILFEIHAQSWWKICSVYVNALSMNTWSVANPRYLRTKDLSSYNHNDDQFHGLQANACCCRATRRGRRSTVVPWSVYTESKGHGNSSEGSVGTDLNGDVILRGGIGPWKQSRRELEMPTKTRHRDDEGEPKKASMGTSWCSPGGHLLFLGANTVSRKASAHVTMSFKFRL